MKTESKVTLKRMRNRIVPVCVTVLLVLMNSGILLAQRTAVPKEEVPMAVQQAVEDHFLPVRGDIQWYVQNRRLQTDHYVIIATGRNIRTESVFDAEGNLVRSVTEMENVKLPSSIQRTVAGEYPGWRITGDRVVIPDFDENNKQFHVLIENNGQEEELDFDAEGRSLRGRDILVVNKKAVDRDEIPDAVVRAVEEHYLPAQEKIRWYVQNRRMRSDYYVITATGTNITSETVFDRKGNLVRSVTVMENVKLPTPVQVAIARQYPGWQITEDQVIIRDFNDSKTRFEVVVTKNGETQTLYFDRDGNWTEKPGV